MANNSTNAQMEQEEERKNGCLVGTYRGRNRMGKLDELIPRQEKHKGKREQGQKRVVASK